MTDHTIAMLEELLAHVEDGDGPDNALDVRIEIALFQPCSRYMSARANNAGTKAIYTDRGGKKSTHWAEDWTMTREDTADSLRAAIMKANNDE